MFIFGLILIKPSKSDIFCADYCQESMDYSILSDYPINKFSSVSIYTHVGCYRIVLKVVMCLQLNCFPLVSLILYLIFESIPQIIYRRFT